MAHDAQVRPERGVRGACDPPSVYWWVYRHVYATSKRPTKLAEVVLMEFITGLEPWQATRCKVMEKGVGYLVIYPSGVKPEWAVARDEQAALKQQKLKARLEDMKTPQGSGLRKLGGQKKKGV